MPVVRLLGEIDVGEFVQWQAFYAAEARDESGWSQQDELAAGQIETIDAWFRILAQLLGAKPAKLPKPPKIEHPDRKPAGTQERVLTDPGEIARWLRANG